MAQKNRTNMLSDIVTNIYTNIINYITGNNAQQRLINLLDSSPNILSDKDQENGYVGTNASNEMLSAYYSETITYANIVVKQGAATLVPRKFYVITNAVGGTKFLRVQAATDSTLYGQANDLTAGTTGTYVLGTDTYMPSTGSSSAPIPITNAALLTAIGASGLTADALYRVTDAPNYPAVIRALTTSTVTSEAEIEGFGWGNYDATSNTWVGLMYDALGNVYNGVLPSEITLGGTGCKRNIFNKLDSGTFVFNNNLTNLTIEAGCPGQDLTASPDYDFMYSLHNSSRIFSNGTANFHEYWDGTQYVITNLTTLAVTNVGASGDRYKTTSATSRTITNTGSLTFTVDAGLSYIPLQEVLIVYDASNYMIGTVTSYSGTTLTVDVNHKTGSGTYAAWTINLDGTPVDALTGSGSANQVGVFSGAQTVVGDANLTFDTATDTLSTTNIALSGAINEAQGTNIASASTTDIGAATGNSVTVTGTTTITALGTVQAGTRRIVTFSGILTLTYNATSLILPTAANITTQAGDVAAFVSLGSGNWKCVTYLRADGTPLLSSDHYPIYIQALNPSAPISDSTNYFCSPLPITLGTVGARKFKFTGADTLVAATLCLFQSTNGSGETVTIYLRNETAGTETAIGTLTSDFGANSTLTQIFTGLSIVVNTTQEWTVKFATPAFSTNPSNWTVGLNLIMKKA